MGERYKVVDGSETAHCCFRWSVIDVTHERATAIDYRYVMCECFDKAHADSIAAALNAAA